MSLFASLANTRESLARLIGMSRLTSMDIEHLEEELLLADCGLQLTDQVISFAKGYKGSNFNQDLKTFLCQLLILQQDDDVDCLSLDTDAVLPQVILVVGVNGAGKTTSIAKLTKRITTAGHSVAWASGDCFRAAASEQLSVWAERLEVVLLQVDAVDPAAVAYQAMQTALEQNIQYLLIDTAGRQFNNQGLMAELGKVYRTIQKFGTSFPQRVWLVIEAGSGQNGVAQAQEFAKHVPVSGCIVTKLDGTAKAGMIMSLVHDLQLPVKFLGTGEKAEDLQTFNVEQFVDSLLTRHESSAS